MFQPKFYKILFLFFALAGITNVIYKIGALYLGNAPTTTFILMLACPAGIFLCMVYNAEYHSRLDPSIGVPAIYLRYGKWISAVLTIAILAVAAVYSLRYFLVILAGLADGWLFAYWLAPLMLIRD